MRFQRTKNLVQYRSTTSERLQYVHIHRGEGAIWVQIHCRSLTLTYERVSYLYASTLSVCVYALQQSYAHVCESITTYYIASACDVRVSKPLMMT